MEIKVQIGYEQILDILKQLPQEELDRLLVDAQKLLSRPKKAYSRRKKRKNTIVEEEKAWMNAFGSWQSNETADEIIEDIYSSRISHDREIDL